MEFPFAVLLRSTLAFSLSLFLNHAGAAEQELRWSNYVGKPDGPGYIDGKKQAALFDAPAGIAVDSSGHLYVLDSQNSLVREITPNGMVTRFAGQPGNYETVDGTEGIAVAPDKTIYFAGKFSVRRIGLNGEINTLAGGDTWGAMDGSGTEARFLYPTDLAVDKEGNVYVADALNYAIRKITPSGFVSTLAGKMGMSGRANGSGTDARFKYPFGLFFDAPRNVLYVADMEGDSICKVTLNGKVTTVATLPGWNPTDVTSDVVGNLYVIDNGKHVVRKIDTTGKVTILAGKAGFFGEADGTGATARFDNPRSIVMGADNAMYLSDETANTIRRVSTTGVVTTRAGKATPLGGFSVDGPVEKARTALPGPLLANAQARLYFADNFGIRIVSPQGVVSTLAQTVDSGSGLSHLPLSGADGMARDATGNTFLAYSSNQILKVQSNGKTSLFAGKASGEAGSADGVGSAASFFYPIGLTSDSQGNLYVADTGNNLIRKITSAGVVTTIAGVPGHAGSDDGLQQEATFNRPAGLAFDESGNLYVADSANSVIRKIATDGQVTTLAGQKGVAGGQDGTGSSAQFASPFGLTMGADKNLYVTDSSNNRADRAPTLASTIRRVTLDGVVTTVGGSPLVAGRKDGAGISAQFCQPVGIATDAVGNIYVADRANNRISVGRVVTAGKKH